jgi:class 3 adenylate cyclase/tetratricopeptide (TPR) repeat protein
MDVADWLRKLGLEQYEPAFRTNEIDAKVLTSLTAADLKDLGVTLVGHRRRLLDAIAALGAAVPDAAVTGAPRDARAPADAERRQLTVMFCDLVGSTALAARLDPEDLREVIAAYHRTVGEVIARFDGFVANYMGDGVLVYFGYPRAHEDDAERAVRAGLESIDAVGRLDVKSAKLQARVGIATGLVVVGDLIGEGSAQQQSVVGETPNLAARLQALAEPDAVVIAAGTRRLVGDFFEYRDLGAVEVKGIAAPVPAWQVLRPSAVASRFEALRSGTTPLVGRDEEVELLLRRWQQAKTGEGRVALISGEPGIGKSRLTAALSEHIRTEPHTRLRYFCSPYHQDSALYPFIAQLEHAAGFVRDDAVEAKLGKLRALLAPGTQDDDDIALLTELLSLPGSAADLNLSPQRKREKLFEALLNQLEAEARRRPVLMVFEDAHWIDPTSRELLDLTVDRVRRLPVLLAITFRPEFQPPWGGRSHVTSLALNRLGERDGEALVQKLAGNAALTADIVAEIVDRTDGVPLFVEELTKAVLESAAQGDRVAAVLATTSLAALSVPATLHASLMARLDRLGPATKEVAQIGAVLGREFAYELIEPVAQRDERELQAALGQLSEAGLLFCRGTAPHASYLFKHALVQDAAYSTLLRGRRQELHARVAAALEEHFADLLERQPELLAHHLTAAGWVERAVDQWLKAGQFAAARSTHFEAIGRFDRGLALLVSLPETPERDRREIELELARGPSLLTAKGFNSPEAVEAYERARGLCEKRGDAENLFVALWNLWLTTSIRNIDAARPLSSRLLILSERQEDSTLRLEAHHSAWFTRFCTGEPAPARDHCNEGSRLYNFERHHSLALFYGGHDPGVCAHQHGALIDWLLGYPDKAVASLREAVSLAERLRHPLSLSHALIYGSVLHLFRREPDSAFQRANDAEELAAEQRIARVLNTSVLRGAALLGRDELEEATASIRAGLAVRKAWQLAHQYQLTLVSEVLARGGDYDGALAALAEAEAAIQAGAERWWEAEIHRRKGVVLLSLNLVSESEGCFERSLGIARKQQAKSLELRAAASLAQLWGE